MSFNYEMICFTNILVFSIVCRLHISKFHAIFYLWQTSLRLYLERSRSFDFGKWFWKMDLLEQDKYFSKPRPGIILESCYFEMSILLIFIKELQTTPVVLFSINLIFVFTHFNFIVLCLLIMLHSLNILHIYTLTWWSNGSLMINIFNYCHKLVN